MTCALLVEHFILLRRHGLSLLVSYEGKNPLRTAQRRRFARQFEPQVRAHGLFGSN